MTRKDYIIIAKALREANINTEAFNIIANAFYTDNPRFDFEKFKKEVLDLN